MVENGGRKEIMSFDVRSEKFKFIQTQNSAPYEDWDPNPSLVSYKGKLAWVVLESSFYKLWILEDAEKQEWSCQDFHIPISLEDPIVKVYHFLSSVTEDGEFVYVSVSWQDKEIYVSYYDPKRKSNRRVKIEIFEDDDFWIRNARRDNWEFLGSIPNHIENLMSLKHITTCSPSAC
ncbi:putative F-box associated interaction domain-containing protein [Arabidopsis thaliana]